MFAAALMGVFMFLVVSALALGQWMGRPPEVADKKPTVAVIPSRFFSNAVAGEPVKGAQPVEMPVEVFLSQLENHIRLENAAAENFIFEPSSGSLHAPTTSPLRN